MNNNKKYIAIDDIKIIDNLLTLKQIEHSINVFEADSFTILIDNEEDNYQMDENGKIISISPNAIIYIGQKIDDDNYTIDEIITNELEINNIVFSKCDIVSFDISGITCRGIIIDFDSDGICLYIQALVPTEDNGFTILNIPFNSESNIMHVSRLDKEIIDKIVNAIEK